jgi:hypothetical protein
VRHSSLTLVRRGAALARVSGEIQFDGGFRIVVVERLLADRRPVTLDAYGYEIWRGQEKLCWYDCQPHPKDASLQSTHPHHKHVPPDIKHNRHLAPHMDFSRPNLPQVIAEVETLISEQPG